MGVNSKNFNPKKYIRQTNKAVLSFVIVNILTIKVAFYFFNLSKYQSIVRFMPVSKFSSALQPKVDSIFVASIAYLLS